MPIPLTLNVLIMCTNTIEGKVTLLGDQDVGKTSLVLRYIEKEFSKYVSPTIGASYFSCSVQTKDATVRFQIWDTAGQERFKAIAPMFYRKTSIAFFVYDIAKPKTFENLKGWIKQLNKNTEESVIVIVIGNKIDLCEYRKVPKDLAIAYSQSMNATYHECSALTGEGVEEIFESAASLLFKKFSYSQKRLDPNIVAVRENEESGTNNNSYFNNCC